MPDDRSSQKSDKFLNPLSLIGLWSILKNRRTPIPIKTTSSGTDTTYVPRVNLFLSRIRSSQLARSASRLTGRDMPTASAAAHAEPRGQLWPEIEATLRDPEIADAGDPAPSPQAVALLRNVIEATQGLLPAPIPHPHVELFEGSIRLIWTGSDRNIRLVIASQPDRRSYLYHEEVRNGLGTEEGMSEPTSENLAHWLSWIQS